MLDLSYFQNNTSNTQVFTNAGTWQVWQKPRAAKFVNILCIGSGGGGGGGLVTGSNFRGGGGGGGAGAIMRTQYQASILPDLLYIYTGIGGAGGVGGVTGVVTAGGNGDESYICLIPSTASISNIVCVSGGTTSARGGSAGTTGTATRGVGELVATTTNALFLNLGTFTAIAGTDGSNGSYINTGTGGVTPSQITCGGAGGGGNSTSGGGSNILAAGPFPQISGGAQAGATGNGGNGTDGIILYKPILGFTGGSGGGGAITANTAGAGGNGGNGAYGCGGGGGAGSATTAGNGGKGGDGIVIISVSY